MTTIQPHGPFETEREAHRAALAIGGPPRAGWSILSPEQSARMLTGACQAAGVELGDYDRQTLTWLAGFEDSSCAAIAGLISRAHAGVLDQAEVRTVLAALDVAADYKRDRAASCPDCDADPSDLCGNCDQRLADADGFAALAAKLGGAL